MIATIIFLWLADVVGAVQVLLVLCAVLVFAVLVMLAVNSDFNNDWEFFRTVRSRLIAGAAACALLAALIPSKPTMYAIGGILAANSVISTAADSDLGRKSVELINRALDRALEKGEKE